MTTSAVISLIDTSWAGFSLTDSGHASMVRHALALNQLASNGPSKMSSKTSWSFIHVGALRAAFSASSTKVVGFWPSFATGLYGAGTEPISRWIRRPAPAPTAARWILGAVSGAVLSPWVERWIRWASLPVFALFAAVR